MGAFFLPSYLRTFIFLYQKTPTMMHRVNTHGSPREARSSTTLTTKAPNIPNKVTGQTKVICLSDKNHLKMIFGTLILMVSMVSAKSCRECGGSGQVPGMLFGRNVCSECNGTGNIPEPCGICFDNIMPDEPDHSCIHCHTMFHRRCMRRWQNTNNDKSGGFVAALKGLIFGANKCCPYCGKQISLVKSTDAQMKGGYYVLNGGGPKPIRKRRRGK